MRRFAKAALLPAMALPARAAAQNEPGWLVDTLYGSGKINVVLAVVAVILLGLTLWLVAQERRIARLEKRIKP